MHEDLPIEVLRNRDTKSLIPTLHGAFLKNEGRDAVRTPHLHEPARERLSHPITPT